MDTKPTNAPTLHVIKLDTRLIRLGRIDDELRRRNTHEDESPDLAFDILTRWLAEDSLSSFVGDATRINNNGGGDNRLWA